MVPDTRTDQGAATEQRGEVMRGELLKIQLCSKGESVLIYNKDRTTEYTATDPELVAQIVEGLELEPLGKVYGYGEIRDGELKFDRSSIMKGVEF